MTRNRELVATYRKLVRVVGKISNLGGGHDTLKALYQWGHFVKKGTFSLILKSWGHVPPVGPLVPTSLKLVDC